MNNKILIPLIRKIIPNLIAQDILGVQPIRTFDDRISFDKENPLIADISSKFKIDKEFIEWCNLHGIVFKDFSITIPDEETKVLFKLRWCCG